MKHNIKTVITLSVYLLLTGAPSHAEIYKWYDEKGNAHFSDAPSASHKTEEVKLTINTYAAVEIKSLAQRLGQKGKVVMYTATWCGICKKAERYFDENKIPYKTYDVENNIIGKRDFKLLGGKSVPVLIVGTKRMNGFTVPRFEKLYDVEVVQKRQAEKLEAEKAKAKQPAAAAAQ